LRVSRKHPGYYCGFAFCHQPIRLVPMNYFFELASYPSEYDLKSKLKLAKPLYFYNEFTLVSKCFISPPFYELITDFAILSGIFPTSHLPWGLPPLPRQFTCRLAGFSFTFWSLSSYCYIKGVRYDHG